MKMHSKKAKTVRATFGVAGTLGLAGILGIGIYSATNMTNISDASALSYSTSEDISFTFAPTLSIGLSTDNLTIDNLVPGTTSDSNAVTVTVASNTPYGYVLSAGVGSTESTDPYYNTSDLVHDNTTTTVPTTNKFSSIATSASLQTLDTDNTWGYSTSTDGGTSWSTYSGLSHTTTKPLLDISDPATPSTIDFKIAARSASTQASGTYNNVITFYAVGKPEPRYLYEEVAKMSKGTQTLADLRTTIAAPTGKDYREDTSNSGVYEYNSAVFGESSDASNANKIYYYRGVLEPEEDQGQYGSDGQATTYPNYVKLGNNTCWRIVRTTGSGGVKMIYNGTWTGTTCANSGTSAQVATQAFADKGTSRSTGYWFLNIHYVGYTYNNAVTDSWSDIAVDTVFGNNSDLSLNNTRSNIKTYIEDTWYANNMTDHTDELEPSAGYCSDRTVFSDYWNVTPILAVPPIGYSEDVYFGADVRNRAYTSNATTSLNCPRGEVDLYHYTTNSTGISNELKFPVALVTADELNLAGSGGYYTSYYTPTFNVKSFMDTGSNFWTLTPSMRRGYGQSLVGFCLRSNGELSKCNVTMESGIRPSISLKPGTEYASGSGTATDPWIIPAPQLRVKLGLA